MGRIIKPLAAMGARIVSLEGNGCAPLKITGSPLRGITWHSPVASAQVKSAILCAGLYADSPTRVIEPALSRDHTERMLKCFGASVTSAPCPGGYEAGVLPCSGLHACEISIPGDISSAAYFIAASLLLGGSQVLIRGVGINPTRAGILEAVRAMGGKIEYLNRRPEGEPTADLLVTASPLHGCTLEGDLIPTLIDELPVCAVMAAYAEGKTVIKDAAELKVKESDRISAMTAALSAMGCDITATDDGMIIDGGRTLHGASVDSCKDHRIAMSMAVAALHADTETQIGDADCVDISYPEFYSDLFSLMQ
jgi:3-phosphoshikimate 1-carboxyvinyltransferase